MKAEGVNSCRYVGKDVLRGCLVGGAIGDALGYPVEFMEDYEIFKKYGENGVTRPVLYGGVAHISDDTQMTLFTAQGLLRAENDFPQPTSDDYVTCVYKSYVDWLYTQDRAGVQPSDPLDPLLKVKELFSQRAPGNTCLYALASGRMGSLTEKINDSKGCGGIMRIAPVALALVQNGNASMEEIAMVSARVSAITHTHVLGYVPSAFLAIMLACVARGSDLREAFSRAETCTKALFSHLPQTEESLKLNRLALRLAESEDDDLECIRALGDGWVAEETLAIALYCAFRHADDFMGAVVAAANHSGDSDSTAAVTGNLMGAYLGYKSIPRDCVETLECRDLILSVADALQKS